MIHYGVSYQSAIRVHGISHAKSMLDRRQMGTLGLVSNA